MLLTSVFATIFVQSGFALKLNFDEINLAQAISPDELKTIEVPVRFKMF